MNIPERIAVLSGGDSPEREVSLASGNQAAVALAMAGYQPVLIDPTSVDLFAVDWSTLDVCCIALHGGSGENGEIQAVLEQFGVPYTGSGPAASRLAMDKSEAKEQFGRFSVPTLPFFRLRTGAISKSSPNQLGYPLVIKPNSQGSSLGVSIAHGPNDLRQAIESAARYDDELLAESYVRGREFTISLLGRDPLPMIEIVAGGPLFTYDRKYSNSATECRFDSRLTPPVEASLYKAAISAAEALGTSGLVRVDLMLDDQHHPWVLEVNTIPGLTARSLAPRSAAAAGIEMPALVDWMVRDAVARRRRGGKFGFRSTIRPQPLGAAM